MMPSMMSGTGTVLIFWLVSVIVFGLLLLVSFLWLAISWLKGRKAALRQSTPQPHESVENWPSYEQGYQAQEIYQEGGHLFLSNAPQERPSPVQQDEIIVSRHQ